MLSILCLYTLRHIVDYLLSHWYGVTHALRYVVTHDAMYICMGTAYDYEVYSDVSCYSVPLTWSILTRYSCVISNHSFLSFVLGNHAMTSSLHKMLADAMG